MVKTETATIPTTTEEKPAKQAKTALPDNAPPCPTMPYVELGMVVVWHMGAVRGQAPHAAIVTSISHGNLSLLVLNPLGGYQFKDGVKHIGDPRITEADMEEDLGAWEHTSLNQMLLDLVGKKWEYSHSLNRWV